MQMVNSQIEAIMQLWTVLESQFSQTVDMYTQATLKGPVELAGFMGFTLTKTTRLQTTRLS